MTALLDDKPEFVELFLQNGLSMRDFVTPEILCLLYAGVSMFIMDLLDGLFSRSAERSELLIKSEARSAESQSDVARIYIYIY